MGSSLAACQTGYHPKKMPMLTETENAKTAAHSGTAVSIFSFMTSLTIQASPYPKLTPTTPPPPAEGRSLSQELPHDGLLGGPNRLADADLAGPLRH